MSNQLTNNITDDGVNTMEPNLLKAAERGSIQEARAALEINPDAIHETDKYRLNALQIAICQCHQEFACFLLNETKISVLYTDALGRSGMTLTLQYGGEALIEAVENRAREEYDAMYPSSDNKASGVGSAPKPL